MATKYITMTNRDLQLVADILRQNSSKTGSKIGNQLFGGRYGDKIKISPKAFGILTKKDKKILRDPKYYPLYYGQQMIKTDWVYKEKIRPKLKDVI